LPSAVVALLFTIGTAPEAGQNLQARLTGKAYRQGLQARLTGKAYRQGLQDRVMKLIQMTPDKPPQDHI